MVLATTHASPRDGTYLLTPPLFLSSITAGAYPGPV